MQHRRYRTERLGAREVKKRRRTGDDVPTGPWSELYGGSVGDVRLGHDVSAGPFSEKSAWARIAASSYPHRGASRRYR